MQPGLLRTALVLGLLSMVGPFAIDMYLPAMPAIAAGLGTTEGGVQATLTAYFLAFGVAQMVYGPWADQSGRKLPILTGIVVFFIGSVGAALAGSVEALVLWRAVQGLGGAAVMVVPRAVIRDLYTGPAATRMMAMIMLVISVSPMLAPLAGSLVLSLAGWRMVFWVLAGAAVLSVILTVTLQPETLPVARRRPVRLDFLLRGSRQLLSDPLFMGLTLVGGFGMASFFVFLASASFVYTGQYGLSPTGFSLAFAINAVGFFSASQAAGPLAVRLGMTRLILLGVGGFACFTMGLLVVTALGGTALWVLILGLFLGNACLGTVIPTTMVLALEPHGEVAGLASSLGGTLQMLVGGVMIAVSAPFFDGTALPMVAVIAFCGAAALALSLLTLRNLGAAPAQG